MSTIRFPYSNSLQFIRLEDYDKLQTDTTRLYFDLDFQNIENTCGFVKFLDSDQLWLQYRTDYLEKTCYLVTRVDEDTYTEIEITSNIIEIADLTTFQQYQLTYDLTGLDGYYAIKFEFNQDEGKPIATYQSQWFEVNSSYEYHNKIEWNNSGDLPTNNDGIIWGDVNQFMYVDSRLSNYIPVKEITIIKTASGKNIPTQSTIGKSKLWQVEPLPAHIAETINIALGKSKFYVNGERFTSEDSLELERLGDLNEYPFEISLRLIEDINGNGYEDYTEDQELDGTIVPVTDNYLLINDSSDNLLINSTDLLLNSGA